MNRLRHYLGSEITVRLMVMVIAGFFFSSAAFAQTTYEAEPPDATLSGGATEGTALGGYTGAGYAIFDGSGQTAEWTYNAPTAGTYQIDFRYLHSVSGQPRKMDFTIDSVAQTQLSWNKSTSWGYSNVQSYTLTAGSHTFQLIGTSTSTINVDHMRVTPPAANNPPIITEGNSTSVTMSEDGSPTPFSLTLNATDADGDTITWSISSQGTNGTASASGTGTSKVIGYTPTANWFGSDSFVVQVSDGNGGTDTITVNVTVNSVNDDPVITVAASATPSTVTLPATTSVSVTATDVDTGDTLTYTWSKFSGPGTVNFTPNGTSLSNDSTASFSTDGSYVLRVTVSDGNGGTVTSDVSVTVEPGVNNPPVITEGTSTNVTMDEDGTPTAFSLTLNATDADGDTITWSIFSQGSNGTASASGTGLSKAIGYTPTADWNGSDSFVVRVSDGNGGTDDITVNVTVDPVNDAPVAVADSYSTPLNTTLNEPAPGVLSNDTDVDNGTLFAVNWDTSALPGGHSFTGNADGSFSYSPKNAFTGSVTVSYTVNDGTVDGNTVVVTLNVTAGNTPPVITEGATIGVTMDEDGSPTAFSLTLNATDADGDTITWSIFSQGSNGTASASGTGLSKAIGYTPTANYNGSDSFVVRVSDGNGGTDDITVNVTINPINDDPVITVVASASPSTIIQPANTTSLSVTATDVDSGSLTYTWSKFSGPGTVNFSPNGNTTSNNSTATIDTLGSYVLRVTVTDGSGGSATSDVNVTVTDAGNGPPVITEGASTNVTMSEDGSPTPFSLTLNATDPDGDTITWSIQSQATNGTASASGTGLSKSIGYTPAANWNGSDSFVVQVSDGNGGTDTITVNVTVDPTNDAPFISQGSSTNVTMSEDGTPIAFDLTLSAIDIDGDTITWSIQSQGSNGTASASGTGASIAIGYTPNANFNGSDSFVVRVSDGNGGTADITVNVTVSPMNDLPVITEGATTGVTMSEDGSPTPFSLTLNATDIDGDTLTWSILTDASNGVVIVSGTGASKAIAYTPFANFNGSDSFVVRVTDGNGGDDSITVDVTVQAVNDAPVAVGETYRVDKDTPFSLAAPGVLANDTDVELDSLTAVLDSGPSNAASFSLNSNGSFNYTPNAGFVGQDSFTYHADDGPANSATVTVILRVVGPHGDYQCTDCHNSHGSATSAFLPTGDGQKIMCESCHNPSGAASGMANIGTHEHAGQASIQLDCGACHDTHSYNTSNDTHAGALPGQPVANVKYIRNDPDTFVTGALSNMVYQVSGTHRAFDSNPRNGACQACHTNTTFARNDGSDTAHSGGIDYSTNCFGCHAHADSFAPSGGGSCTSCHASPQGTTRRAVTGEFSLLRRHGENPAHEDDCIVCHEQTAHQGKKVRLLNVDTGAFLVELAADADPDSSSTEAAKLTQFCLKCHDSGANEGAAGDPTPFRDSNLSPAPINQNWAGSIHATRSCYGDGVFGCHSTGHGSGNASMLANSLTEEDFCLNCHKSGGPSGAVNLKTNYDASIRWSTQNGDLNDRHDVQSAAQSTSGAVLECKHCHDVHAEKVSGVYPLLADPDPNDGRNPANAGSYSLTDNNNSADFMTRWCLDCHDGSTPSGVTMTGGMTQMLSAYEGNDAHGAQTSTMTISLTGGWSAGYVVQCLDCHSAHMDTKRNLFHLRDKPLNTSGVGLNSNIGSTGANYTYYESGDNASRGHDWCYTCHQVDSAMDGKAECVKAHAHGGSKF